MIHLKQRPLIYKKKYSLNTKTYKTTKAKKISMFKVKTNSN